jgi:hypothetical protein
MTNWTVQDAKSQLSEILRRARAGEPQKIGVADACIVVSEKDWIALQASELGSWLVENAPKGAELVVPARNSKRSNPFEDRKE